MTDSPIIKVVNVNKSFASTKKRSTTLKSAFTGLFKFEEERTEKRVTALRDINIDIKKGEFFGIVGRNGSGKSTLLKILAGIYQPESGHIEVNGKLVPFIELGVGFNPELTGKENIYLNGALLGFTKKEMDLQYQGIVDFAELEDFMSQKLKNYSSGMQVRLAFSIATLAEAEILLIDEVLAVGDASFQRKCFDFFQQIKNKETTVVFVTHDMSAVREYCDRAMLINKNEVVAIGDPDKIANEYTKLFNNNKQKTGSSDKRWGDGSAKISKVSIKPIGNKAKITDYSIKMQVKAKSAIQSPIFGFVVKGPTGTGILGTNNQLIKRKVKDMLPGEKLEVEWIIPNIFNEGKYRIDLAVLYDNGVSVCDWWDEAAALTITKDHRTPYIVNPEVTLNIS